MITATLTWTAYLLASLVLAHGAWWTLLALVALKRPSAAGRDGDDQSLRMVVVVPAHNEDMMVGATVRSLLAAPYEPRPEVVVVADNCTDATAFEARQAGATVLVRTEPERRGKSFALDFALAHLSASERAPDAVIFVDADSTVSPSFYAAINSRLERGADVVQIHYAVSDGEAPLVRLRALAFALVHWARPLGAARLGLGGSLKGNGMAFRWAVVRDGFAGAGLTEDAAATLDLARRGIAVRFEPGATVWGHMAANYADATVQDRRWEAGRFGLVAPAVRVAVGALARGRVPVAAGALEVASLPLSALLAASLMPVVVAAIAGASVVLPLAAIISLGLYAVIGWSAARIPGRQLLALVSAPRFVLYKFRVLGALLVRRGPDSWQRTSRAEVP